MASSPYSDWAKLPDWTDQGARLGTAEGKSLATLGNLYDTYSDLMGGELGAELLESLGKYDPSEEEFTTREILKQDAKSFEASSMGAQEGFAQQQASATKKIGKAGIGRSGSAMKALSEMKDQYGEDMTSLRKDMQSKRLKAMADITGQRDDYRDELHSLYTTWYMAKPEDIDAPELAAEKITCAEKGGKWIDWAGQNRCSK